MKAIPSFSRKSIIIRTMVVFLLLFLSACHQEREVSILQGNTLQVNTSTPKFEISKTLYGAFFEDINYGGDFGLYSEMISNRSFEYENPLQDWYSDTTSALTSKEDYQVIFDKPLNQKNTHYLRVVNTSLMDFRFWNQGIANLFVEESKEYQLSFYIREGSREGIEEKGTIKVAFMDQQDQLLSHWYEIDLDKAQEDAYRESLFKKIELSMVANSGSKNAKLVFVVGADGAFEMDMISLMPKETYKNRVNGMRKDLAESIEELKPSFFRFPGGCIVEGNSLQNMYRWKDTIGDVAERPINKNLWGYYQSYGIGFYEYFQFCEDIQAEPLPVINAGMACQVRTTEMIPLGEMDPYVQDALDLIEFANGDAQTYWGSKRAEMGHEEPFHMKYLAIGNEQWGTEYFKRYELFRSAILERYPEIELVFAAGPLASGAAFNQAWTYIQGSQAAFVDEHFYMEPKWFFQNTKRYDVYDREGPKVFVGEYAAHAPSRQNNMETALAEAAFMTGLEENSDIVAMASYAPLLAFDGKQQWAPDLIWFNQESFYKTPNYYVQQMFQENKGTRLLESELNIAASNQEVIPIQGAVGLGTWSTQVEYKDFLVESLDGEVLYDAKQGGGIEDFVKVGGRWDHDQGKFTQSSDEINAYIYTGKKLWKNYRIQVKAMKKGGNEGFLIPFGVKDQKNFYWWNLGGWNNTLSAIEHNVQGVKTNVGASESFQIEEERWYDLEVIVEGDLIQCYIDGQRIHEERDRSSYDSLYATVSETDEEYIVKVVNASSKDQELEIRFEGLEKQQRTAEITILGAATLVESNSMTNPEKIVPYRISETIELPRFTYGFTKYSVTVISIKK